MYLVYQHIRFEDNWRYVGMTKYGDEPNRRWRNGEGYKNQEFGKVCRGDLWNDFKHDCTYYCTTQYEAELMETLLILEHNSTKFGWNRSYGMGIRHIVTEDQLMDYGYDLKDEGVWSKFVGERTDLWPEFKEKLVKEIEKLRVWDWEEF